MVDGDVVEPEHLSLTISVDHDIVDGAPAARFVERLRREIDRRAAIGREKPSSLAALLIDEGLRMDDHPGVSFHDSAAHGRVACLAGGPDIAEVLDVLTGLDAQGEDRIAETATWFGIHPSRVRVAMGYYAAFRDEIDHQIDLRRREAVELRGRYGAEQALLE